MISEDFVKLLIQIIVILGFSFLIGQIMRRIKQPLVLGELLAGLILGSTILGYLFPGTYNWLFQSSENVTIIRENFINLGMLFFMFTIGFKINTSDFRKQWKSSLIISIFGTLLPISIGMGLVYALPINFWNISNKENLFVFSVFIGICFANSANPVIARVLMDIGCLKNKLGVTIMITSVIDDIINWLLFAFILSLITPRELNFYVGVNIDVFSKFLLFAVVLALSRKIINKTLGFMRKQIDYVNAVTAYVILLILFVSYLAEFLGMHAFLGAFAAGVLIADHSKENLESLKGIENFSLSFFAPIYFASIGIGINFIKNFDWKLVTIFIVAACVTKFGSVLLGALAAGMKMNRQTLAIASGLNARGATGIILGGIGLSSGLITDRIFVAIFIMAFVTSLMSCFMLRNTLTKNQNETMLEKRI
ncbi:MAG: cation:proton antiporter [Lachnospiraceae bacterium]|nr:cation:proton antiporter [Lachnospiraceae bacterium]